MTPALRWAAMRAILMFHSLCEGQSHKTVSTNHNFWRERRTEADSNRGPSAYQPNALPLGHTGSQRTACSQFSSFNGSAISVDRWRGRVWVCVCVWDELPQDGWIIILVVAVVVFFFSFFLFLFEGRTWNGFPQPTVHRWVNADRKSHNTKQARGFCLAHSSPKFLHAAVSFRWSRQLGRCRLIKPLSDQIWRTVRNNAMFVCWLDLLGRHFKYNWKNYWQKLLYCELMWYLRATVDLR